MAAPVNTVLPVITGLEKVGEFLSVDNGTWDDLGATFAFAWTRDGVAIGGASSNSYVVRRADIGASLAATVTATNGDGSTAQASVSTAQVPGTLVVEDGTGYSDSDSYASVEDVDAYHDKRGNTTWAAFSALDKEAAIRRATTYIDARYGQMWLGQRAADGQALDWPREYVPGTWSYYLDSTPLPSALLAATAELALRSAGGTDLSPDLGPAVKQETVGPITTIYADSGSRSEVEFSYVDSLLAPLVGFGHMIRVVRG